MYLIGDMNLNSDSVLASDRTLYVDYLQESARLKRELKEEPKKQPKTYRSAGYLVGRLGLK